MNVRIALEGASPLLMHSPRMLDPEYPLQRELAAITLDEWRVRKAMLESQRIGIERSIAVCDAAIDLINRHGVSKLDEIEGILPETA